MTIKKYEPLNLYTNFKKSAERYPEMPIHFDEELVTFPELGLHTTYKKCEEAIIQKAAHLHKFGVRKEEKVIVYKSAKFDSYILAVAISYIGAVPIMVSPHLPASTIDIFVNRLDQPWLLFDSETSDKSHQLNNLPDSRLINAEQLFKAPLDGYTCEQEELPKDMIAYMTHTSGTTGVPKLIAHSANSMGWRTKYQRRILNFIKPRGLVAFHISPVHSRFNIGVSSLMSLGFPLLPIANPSKANVEKVLREYKLYVLETHPNHFVQWASLAREKPDVFQSIKFYHSTFDAINKETMAVFLRTSEYKKPLFLQIYGQSECGPMILRGHTLQSIETLNARDMGIGVPGLTEVRIVDQDGNPVPAGVSGNIQMLSKGRALTYYKEEARFEENVYGPWWDSGDYGMKDEKGRLFLQDRQVDLVETIDSTLAIEDKLLDTLTFLDEVVIIRGENGSPQPIIAVHNDGEMNWDAWWKAVSDLPHMNEPMVMKYDEIPRTATMKVQRLQMERELKK
ncbi:TPA_asm: acetate--CoA ligase [Listeria monocytogenes]|nr:acetate--CoA ligase [Listeria monocytogenes]HAC4152175.1 acyl-CoA synthetase [Listeria monocytogenes]